MSIVTMNPKPNRSKNVRLEPEVAKAVSQYILEHGGTLTSETNRRLRKVYGLPPQQASKKPGS